MKIKVYGCRGSTAVSRPGSRYGGNTSCVSLVSGGELLVIDAGSGIMDLTVPGHVRFPLNILISHLHLDHINGLGTFSPAWKKDEGVRLFTCSRDERPLGEQVCGVFSPPHWPLPLNGFGAVETVEIKPGEAFNIGVFVVTPFSHDLHPDKPLAFHITDGKKTLVYLLDSEMALLTPVLRETLLQYCRGADLVIFDSAYASEDYPMRKGWGHSTVEDGVRLADEWNCKRMLFTHFDQQYNDDTIDSWRERFADGRFILAKDGLEIEV